MLYYRVLLQLHFLHDSLARFMLTRESGRRNSRCCAALTIFFSNHTQTACPLLEVALQGGVALRDARRVLCPEVSFGGFFKGN